MAETAEKDPVEQTPHDDDAEDDANPNYKTPAQKKLDEIVSADAEDESLQKYKAALLGISTTEAVVIDESKNTVIVDKLALLVEGRDPMYLDLKKPIEELKKSSFTLKEACKYKIQIDFHVQKEIVTGLKYQHKVYRKGVKVDSMKQMMGSYGPKYESHSFITQEEEAPHGMVMRGDYKIKSRFVDDDQQEYANWEWNLSIKKDW